MARELLRLLGEEMAAETPRMVCPGPGQLAAMARGADTGIDAGDLARHLPRCITCARRWDLLQTDACIGIGEAMVILRLKAGEFARTRAEGHALACSKCASTLARLDRLSGLAAGIARPGPLALPVNLLAQARSAGEIPVVWAAVMEADGTPRIVAEQVVHHRSAVLEATVIDGILTVRLETGRGFESAYLAICSVFGGEDAFAVVLPPASIVGGVACWRVPVTANQGVVPADRLAAALVASAVIR